MLIFVLVGRSLGPRAQAASPDIPRFISIDLPIFGALMIATNAVLSFVAIIAIYREGGILKRLRATPLRPLTILTAHVIVKLLFTAVTLVVMILAGRRGYAVPAGVPLVSFTLALLFSTLSILSLGFLIASLVPTARFAQPNRTNAPRRDFRVTVLRVDPIKREMRLDLEVRTPKDRGFGDENKREAEYSHTIFWVGFSDFPMINNTPLWHGYRCAVVLRRFDEVQASITLVSFPTSRAALKDKPYYVDMMDELFRARQHFAEQVR